MLRPAALEALYAEGWAFDQRHPGRARPAAGRVTSAPAVAVGIERPDVAERFGRTPWRSAHAGRSGLLSAALWGRWSRVGTIRARLELADGAVHRRRAVRSCGLAGNLVPLAAPHADVAVVMATYDPPLELFPRQVDRSGRRTTPRGYASSATTLPSAKRGRPASVLGDDDRFVLVENGDASAST